MAGIGPLFLHYATSRCYDAQAAIETGHASGKIPKHSPARADFVKRWQYSVPPDQAIGRIADTNNSSQVEL